VIRAARLRRCGQGPVEHVQQMVVLPEAEAESHRYGDRANDEP
jgi:hypothetical protein